MLGRYARAAKIRARLTRRSEEACTRVYGKTLDELFSMFGQPAREFGAKQKQHIYSDGRSHTFEFRRSFEFDGVGETVYTLRVDEETSGKLHFTMRGRAISQHDNAA